ncbi:MAG: tetratricopeptide repeat protein [Thermodesulfobacteriota bacterium]
MSLIERALSKNKAGQRPLAATGTQGPRPELVLAQSRSRPRVGIMAALGLLLGLAVIGGWLLMEGWRPWVGKGTRAVPSSPKPPPAEEPREPKMVSSGLQAGTSIGESPTQVVQEERRQRAQELVDERAQENPVSEPGADSKPDSAAPTGLMGKYRTAKPSVPKGGALGSQPQTASIPEPSDVSRSPKLPSTAQGSYGGAKGTEDQAAQKRRLLLEKAYLNAQAGQTASAIGIYDQILQSHPGDAEALLNRGVLRARSGDLHGAKQDLLKAKELNPSDPTLLNALGVLYMEMGELDEATVHLRQSTEPYSLVNLALVYWKKGEGELAMEVLRMAQKRLPEDPLVAHYEALLLRELGRLKDAHRAMDRAKTLARTKGDMQLLRKLEADPSAP